MKRTSEIRSWVGSQEETHPVRREKTLALCPFIESDSLLYHSKLRFVCCVFQEHLKSQVTNEVTERCLRANNQSERYRTGTPWSPLGLTGPY